MRIPFTKYFPTYQAATAQPCSCPPGALWHGQPVLFCTACERRADPVEIKKATVKLSEKKKKKNRKTQQENESNTSAGRFMFRMGSLAILSVDSTRKRLPSENCRASTAREKGLMIGREIVSLVFNAETRAGNSRARRILSPYYRAGLHSHL